MRSMTEAPPVLTSTDHIAAACKAAGDPLRMNILRLLGQGAFGVLELSQIFGIKQSGMSHHLKVMSQAGIVSAQREGNSIFYRRPFVAGQDALSQWLRETFKVLDRMPPDAGTAQAVADVLNERTRACAEFFARHADDFREQQDLIASHEQYGQALETLLASLPSAQTALEIGPGEGAFLKPLSQRFHQVTGIDISPDMLSKAGDFCEREQLENVSLLEGDTASLLQQGESRFDFAVANMVLHHVPSPKTIFTEVARLLKPGGSFLVTDLVHHDQEWARTSCGDLWLGFEPADLSQWAEGAGLREGESQYSGLRNGFQIQFRLFHANA